MCCGEKLYKWQQKCIEQKAKNVLYFNGCDNCACVFFFIRVVAIFHAALVLINFKCHKKIPYTIFSIKNYTEVQVIMFQTLKWKTE